MFSDVELDALQFLSLKFGKFLDVTACQNATGRTTTHTSLLAQLSCGILRTSNGFYNDFVRIALAGSSSRSTLAMCYMNTIGHIKLLD